MVKLLIIADDFTGAMDTGAQFSKQGVRTLVTMEQDIAGLLRDTEIEVLSVDAETRHLGAGQAYEIVARLTHMAVEAGIACIYKKTDSTLRGNVGAELDALLDVSPERELIFIPAFPKGKRITVDAIQYVDGVPLGESAFASDPIDPVRHSNVADILRLQCAKPLHHISVQDYLPGVRRTCEKKEIILFDAATDEDLETLGKLLQQNGKLRLLAGCAGFAEYLPQLLHLHMENQSDFSSAGGTLLVAGSVNQLALDQLAVARDRGYRAITLTQAQKLGQTEADDQARMAVAERLIAALQSGRPMILQTIEKREELAGAEECAQQYGMAPEEIPNRIADSVGKIVARVIKNGVVKTLIVFGGDTLLGIMRYTNCKGILPEHEIAPGVVGARVLGAGPPFALITKAGGLGDVRVVETIDAYIGHMQAWA